MVSNKCLFTLWDDTQDEPRLVGMAGLHVDDFLMGGMEGDPVLENAMKNLKVPTDGENGATKNLTLLAATFATRTLQAARSTSIRMSI